MPTPRSPAPGLAVRQSDSLICSIEGCDNRVLSRNWCQKHYARWRKHGDPHSHGRLTLEERFWLYTKKGAPDECWPWIGLRFKSTEGQLRYGRLQVNGRAVGAHRIAWRLLRGEIPSGLMVLHHCDNEPCVNPNHLYVGTARENAQDRERRGRSIKGRKRDPSVVARGTAAGSPLTEDEVRRIKRRLLAGESGSSIAEDFPVTYGTISHIKNGRSWRHVEVDKV